MSDQDNDARLDAHLLTDIWSTLQELETPSAFAFSAVRPSLPNPGLFIPPYGLVGLPLSKDDAQKIISQARQSPFGKGEETVIDTSVRKSWELNTNQFSLNNPDWKETEQEILESVILGLGLPKGMGRVSAELYKLLLYEPGAFFKPHKDSEKAPGMFATLVISLPSPHEGGKLVMTFNGEKYEFETADFSAYRFSFAAWYSDILHEVLPVKSGYRLVLTYNLIRRTNFEIPSYDLVRGRAQQLSMLLKQYDLRVLQNDDELPAILIHKLKHEYTPASLNLRSLKPPDLAQVSTLAQLATELDFCIFLATLELKVNADEEYDDYKEKETRLKNIVDLDGKLILEEFDCLEDALIDKTPQDEDREADESEHEGYTGNEGCPVTYWYRDTVVFLVPPSTKFSFLFRFRSDGSVIESLFNSLMKKYSNGPAQKSKLKKLCKRALKQNIGQGPIPDFFQQAAATALDLGWFDLFEKASEKTSGRIVLDHAHMLGRLIAKNGVAASITASSVGSSSVTLKDKLPEIKKFFYLKDDSELDKVTKQLVDTFKAGGHPSKFNWLVIHGDEVNIKNAFIIKFKDTLDIDEERGDSFTGEKITYEGKIIDTFAESPLSNTLFNRMQAMLPSEINVFSKTQLIIMNRLPKDLSQSAKLRVIKLVSENTKKQIKIRAEGFLKTLDKLEDERNSHNTPNQKRKVVNNDEIQNIQDLQEKRRRMELGLMTADQLMKGTQAASSIPKMVQFLKIVAEGFEKVLPESGSAERATLKQWSDKAIFSAAAELTTPTKSDAASLAQLCKTIDWSLFETEVMPIISEAAVMFTIWFINELMSILGEGLSKEQQLFIEIVVCNIWDSFVFSCKQGGSAFQKKESVNANDVRCIVENTMKIMPPEFYETTIIPAMIKAVPNSSKECSKDVFFPLTQMIVKNEFLGSRLPRTDSVPPLLHKQFVQALLLKYLMDYVGLEPQAPTDWSVSLPKPRWGSPCKCEDCEVVHRFLQNPVQKRLDLKRTLPHHKHLDDKFSSHYFSHDIRPYDCETIRDGRPFTWRITKSRRSYENAKTEWIRNTKTAVQMMHELKSNESADGKLELYLQPHFRNFMNASLKELPDLASLVVIPQLLQTNENVAPAHGATELTNQTAEIGQKRGSSQSDTISAKRSC